MLGFGELGSRIKVVGDGFGVAGLSKGKAALSLYFSVILYVDGVGGFGGLDDWALERGLRGVGVLSELWSLV